MNTFRFLLDGSLEICRYSPWIPGGWLVQMLDDQKMEKVYILVEMYFINAVNTCRIAGIPFQSLTVMNTLNNTVRYWGYMPRSLLQTKMKVI